MTTIYRGWVNAPSTLQDGHEFHGRRVLVERDGTIDNLSGQEVCRVWFTEGPRHSARIEHRMICGGWPGAEHNLPTRGG